MAKQPTEAPVRSDAYTGMLIISLLALIAGCAFLYLDWSSFPKSKPDQLKPLPQSTSGPPQGTVEPAK